MLDKPVDSKKETVPRAAAKWTIAIVATSLSICIAFVLFALGMQITALGVPIAVWILGAIALGGVTMATKETLFPK